MYSTVQCTVYSGILGSSENEIYKNYSLTRQCSLHFGFNMVYCITKKIMIGYVSTIGVHNGLEAHDIHLRTEGMYLRISGNGNSEHRDMLKARPATIYSSGGGSSGNRSCGIALTTSVFGQQSFKFNLF